MPWSETCAMDERMRFIVAASEDEAVMSQISTEFGISRQNGQSLGISVRRLCRSQGAHPCASSSMVGRAMRNWWRRFWRCASVIPPGVPRSCAGSFASVWRGAAAAGAIGVCSKEVIQSAPPIGALRPFSTFNPSTRPTRLVRRVQGLVSDRRQAALRSADDQRREQPLFPALPGRDADGRGAWAA